MKRLFLIVFIFSSNLFSQSNLEKSLLWEITGNGLKQSSYLLGTFHMVCKEDLKLNEKVVKALNNVNQVALEVDLTDPNEITSFKELMYSPVSLSSQLNENEINELRELLKKDYNLDLNTVDHLAPIGLIGFMASKVVPCEVKGFDMEILEKALLAKKKVLGLEQIKEQIKEQIEVTTSFYSAKEILKQMKKEEDFETNYKAMAKAFFDENVVEMYSLVTDSLFMSNEAKIKILDDRNRNWIVKMMNIMPKESTMFAVGAGHLGGEQGVIELLRQKGYTVKAVLN